MPKKENKFFDFGKMKASLLKKKKVKLPKFEVTERGIIELPEGKEIDFKYPLLHPFAIAHLKYDKTKKELVYNLIEPVLTQKEKENYDKIIESSNSHLLRKKKKLSNI
ncbi:MAG: hypothetical protein ACE5J3_11000 [Methanosarcinales archaeon]